LKSSSQVFIGSIRSRPWKMDSFVRRASLLFASISRYAKM
jgi:hypothetical protein